MKNAIQMIQPIAVLGQITRLKLVKRMMYGRAKLDLVQLG